MFTALKPCTISGKKYIIDDEVDVTNLTDKQIAALCKKRYIIETKEAEVNEDVPAMIEVPIINEHETLTLPMTGEQVCEAITILQHNAEDAIEIIKGITDEKLLILIFRVDSRKTVQKAAKDRAEALQPAPNGGGDE